MYKNNKKSTGILNLAMKKLDKLVSIIQFSNQILADTTDTGSLLKIQARQNVREGLTNVSDQANIQD